MSRFVVGALLLVAACGPKGGGGTDPCKDPCKGGPSGKMAAMTCAKMAENVAGAMIEHGEFGEDHRDRMQDMFVSECEGQMWSQEAIDCMAASSNPDEAENCLGFMTPEQRSSLDESFDAAEDGGQDDAEME